jgi:hypothetical protein
MKSLALQTTEAGRGGIAIVAYASMRLVPALGNVIPGCRISGAANLQHWSLSPLSVASVRIVRVMD